MTDGPRAVVLDEGLSLWGGMDPATGDLIDVHHPQRGANLTGRVLVMPNGRGSSSSASVLAEPDLILSIGSAVAEELYGVRVPVVVVSAERLAVISDGEVLPLADL